MNFAAGAIGFRNCGFFYTDVLKGALFINIFAP